MPWVLKNTDLFARMGRTSTIFSPGYRFEISIFSHAFMELATRGKLLLAAPHVIPPREKGGEGDPPSRFVCLHTFWTSSYEG